MKNENVEEQVQWVLIYIQRRSVDIQKKSIRGDKSRKSIIQISRRFFSRIQEGGDDELEKFVKEVKRIVRKSRYKDQTLIKEFKRKMNKHI